MIINKALKNIRDDFPLTSSPEATMVDDFPLIEKLSDVPFTAQVKGLVDSAESDTDTIIPFLLTYFV